jgi:hypothetical protein
MRGCLLGRRAILTPRFPKAVWPLAYHRDSAQLQNLSQTNRGAHEGIRWCLLASTGCVAVINHQAEIY